MRPTIQPTGVTSPSTGTTDASKAHSPDAVSFVSILYGYCRVATAANWADARELLRAHLDTVHAHYARTERSDHFYEMECGRIALNRIEDGFLFTSPRGTFFDVTRYAREGRHGIVPGDLAIIQDCPNGHYGWWTIAVKCKVISIGPLEATVKITGDSSQFTRGETRSIPLSFLRPRAKKVK
jgi:hypothetical protein